MLDLFRRLLALFLDWFLRGRMLRRGFFRYWDGQRWRYADPFALWRTLAGEPALERIAEAEAGQEPAAGQVLAALAAIFAARRYAQSSEGEGIEKPEARIQNSDSRILNSGFPSAGLADWELLDLLRQFEAHLELLKKTTDPGRMPLLLAVLGSSISPGPPEEAESPSSDSGCTASESSEDAPTAPSPPCATP